MWALNIRNGLLHSFKDLKSEAKKLTGPCSLQSLEPSLALLVSGVAPLLVVTKLSFCLLFYGLIAPVPLGTIDIRTGGHLKSRLFVFKIVNEDFLLNEVNHLMSFRVS